MHLLLALAIKFSNSTDYFESINEVRENEHVSMLHWRIGSTRTCTRRRRSVPEALNVSYSNALYLVSGTFGIH
jgi:hypothetical protein